MPDIVTQSTVFIVTHENGPSPEDVATALGIPVIAEIEPHADPVYGHTFKWPAKEVEQFTQMGGA